MVVPFLVFGELFLVLARPFFGVGSRRVPFRAPFDTGNDRVLATDRIVPRELVVRPELLMPAERPPPAPPRAASADGTANRPSARAVRPSSIFFMSIS